MKDLSGLEGYLHYKHSGEMLDELDAMLASSHTTAFGVPLSSSDAAAREALWFNLRGWPEVYGTTTASPLEEYAPAVHRNALCLEDLHRLTSAPPREPLPRSAEAAIPDAEALKRSMAEALKRLMSARLPELAALLNSAMPPRLEDQSKIAALEGRIQKLESRLSALLAMQQGHAEDDVDVPVDPHTRWIEANVDELRKYRGSFVALDAERGIVLHSTDGDEFAARLEALTPEQRERLMVFHTSMYV